MTPQNCDKLVKDVANKCRQSRPSNHTHGYVCGYLDGVVTMENAINKALAAHRQSTAKGCEGTHDFKAALEAFDEGAKIFSARQYPHLSSAAHITIRTALQLAQSMEMPASDRMAALEAVQTWHMTPNSKEGKDAHAGQVLRQHRLAIEAALTTPPKPTPKEVQADPHWWCPSCQREKSPVQVTFEEHCTVCGHSVQWIEDTAAQSQPEVVTVEEFKQIFVQWKNQQGMNGFLTEYNEDHIRWFFKCLEQNGLKVTKGGAE